MLSTSRKIWILLCYALSIKKKKEWNRKGKAFLRSSSLERITLSRHHFNWLYCKTEFLPYRKFKISQILQLSALPLRYYPPNQPKFKCAHWMWCCLSTLVHIIIGFKFVSVFHSNLIADCMKARSRAEVFFHRRKGKVHLPHVSLLFPLSNRANKNHNCDLSVSKSCKYLLTKASYFQKGFPSWPRPKLADLTWLWSLSGRLPPCHC